MIQFCLTLYFAMSKNLQDTLQKSCSKCCEVFKQHYYSIAMWRVKVLCKLCQCLLIPELFWNCDTVKMQIFIVWTKSANPSVFSAFKLLNISTIIPQNDIEHTTVLFNVFELVYVLHFVSCSKPLFKLPDVLQLLTLKHMMQCCRDNTHLSLVIYLKLSLSQMSSLTFKTFSISNVLSDIY